MQRDRAKATGGSENAYEKENAMGRSKNMDERERLMSWREKKSKHGGDDGPHLMSCGPLPADPAASDAFPLLLPRGPRV